MKMCPGGLHKAKVYPVLSQNGINPTWLTERSLTSPLNKSINRLNGWNKSLSKIILQLTRNVYFHPLISVIYPL